LSVLTAGRRSLSRTSTSLNIVTYDVLQRAYDLFEVSFSHYFPGKIDPDDPEIRTRCKAESSDTLDDMLSPLVILITKLCIADEGSRTRVRHLVVPEDLDRSSPLEERLDITGKCLRLLSCVYHPRLKDAIGELLFAIADSDGKIFSFCPDFPQIYLCSQHQHYAAL
jgi:Guanine nucleotide exchange factor synembryn